MNERKIINFFRSVRNTPIHPQWLVNRRDGSIRTWIGSQAQGRVLDIGCSDGGMANYLSGASQYIGLDYPQTAVGWYHTKPQIFADAVRLPFCSESFDTVFLLDVLEHIPDADRALAEASRVLKIEGLLIVKIPFLYPLHDAPLDFIRLTKFGLERKLAVIPGMVPVARISLGTPIETAALLMNIALAKVNLELFQRKSLLLLVTLPFLPLMVIAANLMGAFMGLFSKDKQTMPYSICIAAKKQA